MKKAVFTLLLVVGYLFPCLAQDDMVVLPDSSGQQMFSDFIGIRFWAADYNLHTINQDLQFKYVSTNTGYTMRHDMDLRGLTYSSNIGAGLEEDLGKHLLIHFADVSVGYSKIAWNWNIGCGLGYFMALDKKKNFRLRLSANIFYEDISYGIGSYYDSTSLGFLINGNNIGTSVRNVKYVNNIISSSFGISLLYRAKFFDYFAGASWNHVLTYKDKINFYETKIKPSEGLYDQSGNAVNGNVLDLGNYIIQLGIIREMGL